MTRQALLPISARKGPPTLLPLDITNPEDSADISSFDPFRSPTAPLVQLDREDRPERESSVANGGKRSLGWTDDSLLLDYGNSPKAGSTMEEEREPKNKNRSKKELQEGECEIGESRSLLVSRVGPRFLYNPLKEVLRS
jgi:hypothetical protein